MKYEKRVQERDKQKKMNAKLQEHIKEVTPSNTLNKYKKIGSKQPLVQKSFYESIIRDSMVQQYSSLIKDNQLESQTLHSAKNSTIFS
jgi:hypothetical protein